MIHSPRAQPEVNELHIREVPKSDGLIFHMGEDDRVVIYINHFLIRMALTLTHIDTKHSAVIVVTVYFG